MRASVANDVVQSLGTVSDLWLNASHPLREETIQALQVSTGFSRHQIELAITNCFEELTPAKITAYIRVWGLSPEVHLNASVGTVPRSGFKCVFHVLPANAFTAWVHGAVITLLLGHKCLLKPSAREPVFARAWKASLEEVDPELSQRVEVVAWEEKRLRDSQAVIAYGSDESLEKIRPLLPPGIPFIGYGHKMSVGIVFQEALEYSIDDLLERVCKDAEPFRLQGCLSPQVLYLENFKGTRWPELEARLDVVPKIRSFVSWPQINGELEKFKPFLSCIGYAGSPERAEYLEKELQKMGISRICPLGQMQRPPLSWKNGGMNLVNLLN